MKSHLKQRPWHELPVEIETKVSDFEARHYQELKLHYVENALKSELVLRVPYRQYQAVLEVLLELVCRTVVAQGKSSQVPIAELLTLAELMNVQRGEQLKVMFGHREFVFELA